VIHLLAQVTPVPYPMPIYTGTGGGDVVGGDLLVLVGYLLVALLLWPWFAYIAWHRVLKNEFPTLNPSGEPQEAMDWVMMLLLGGCAALFWPLTGMAYLVYRRVKKWMAKDEAKERERDHA
jgi:TRAP-type C4-dicarboxylate transport system permease small subunit